MARVVKLDSRQTNRNAPSLTQTQTPLLRLLRCHVWIKRNEINVRTEFTMGDETRDEMNARLCSVDDCEIQPCHQTCPCPLALF